MEGEGAEEGRGEEEAAVEEGVDSEDGEANDTIGAEGDRDEANVHKDMKIKESEDAAHQEGAENEREAKATHRLQRGGGRAGCKGRLRCRGCAQPWATLNSG